MIEEILRQLIKKGASEYLDDTDELSIHLEHPADLQLGDFSTNIAMVLGRKAGENPVELAEKLVAKMNKDKGDEISKIEVAGPGFINFFLSDTFLKESLKEVLDKGEEYGRGSSLKGKKIAVEYTDSNPFKEFHIGHIMSNSIGESLSRIFEFSAAEVRRVNYQGDIGMHVAKAVWGMWETRDEMPRDEDPLSVRAEYLGMVYAKGAKAYEESEEAKEKMKEINKHLYERSSQELNDLYDKGRAWSLLYFETIYKRLGTQFDDYYFESGVASIGRRIVEENLGEVFVDSQGATVFLGEKYGLHTRVFINSEGLPTYEAKELGLAKIKFEDNPYDLSFIVTGSEIIDYFKVVLKVMEQIFPDIAARNKHIPHGMLRLKDGKMSSRTGDVITATSILDDAQERVLAIMKEDTLSEKEKKRVADEVAVGAFKYSILRQASGKDIIFDFDSSLSFEGNSGPYLQYTYARTQSVLRKAGEKVADVDGDSSVGEVEHLLYQFPEAVRRSSDEYEPHHIATYLFSLAQSFNTYYAQEKILDGGSDEAYKLALTKAVGITLKNGLYLLGIKAPSAM